MVRNTYTYEHMKLHLHSSGQKTQKETHHFVCLFFFLSWLCCYCPLQVVSTGSAPSTNVSDVHFLLWTRQNPTEGSEQELILNDLDSVAGSFFDPMLQTKVLIHGFTDNGRVSWIQRARDAYLSVGTLLTPEFILRLFLDAFINALLKIIFFLDGGDYNVISVDWELLAGPGPFYFLAADNVVPVGARIGEFIYFLVYNFGGSLVDYHPTGFSLGAQVVGNVGHALSGHLPRITGLDPAGKTL